MWRGKWVSYIYTKSRTTEIWFFGSIISLNLYIKLHLGLCYISWIYSPRFYILPDTCLYRVLQTFLPTHLILWSWQLSMNSGTKVIYSFRSVKHLKLATSDCANIQIFWKKKKRKKHLPWCLHLCIYSPPTHSYLEAFPHAWDFPFLSLCFPGTFHILWHNS